MSFLSPATQVPDVQRKDTWSHPKKGNDFLSYIFWRERGKGSKKGLQVSPKVFLVVNSQDVNHHHRREVSVCRVFFHSRECWKVDPRSEGYVMLKPDFYILLEQIKSWAPVVV